VCSGTGSNARASIVAARGGPGRNYLIVVLSRETTRIRRPCKEKKMGSGSSREPAMPQEAADSRSGQTTAAGARGHGVQESEVVRTVACSNVVPIGIPRKPSVSAVPSQIAHSATSPPRCVDLMLLDGGRLRSVSSAPSRNDALALALPSAEYISSTAEDIFSDRERLPSSPLSLLELCMRTLCHYTRDWVAKDGAPRINFYALPPEIVTQLFEMVRKHKLLREDILPAFQGCEIAHVYLSQYPDVSDSWLPAISLLQGLRMLDLSHCSNITDEGFRSLACLGYGKGQLEGLVLECCASLSDASVAFVVHALAPTLKELNLSGCSRLTDATLARILMARKLRSLSLNRCQLMTATYLCQLGLLWKLQHLDIGLIPNVDDNVLSAFRPCVAHGVPFLMKALEICYREDLDEAAEFPMDALTSSNSEDFVELESFFSLENDTWGYNDEGYDEELANYEMESPDSEPEGQFEFNVENEGLELEHKAGPLLCSPMTGSGCVLEEDGEDELEADFLGQSPDSSLGKRKISNGRLSSGERKSPFERVLAPVRRGSSVSLKALKTGSRSMRKLKGTVSPLRLSGKRRSSVSDRGGADPARDVDPSSPSSQMMCRATYELQSIKSRYEHENVMGLYHLESLNLENTDISSAGCRSISCLKNLRKLVISQTQVARDGVQHLKALSKLEHLEAAHCYQLGDAAGSLLRIESLKYLNLEYVSIGSFERDLKMGSLQELNVSNTSIADLGLQVLSQQAPNLRKLKLEACRVTRHGVSHLINLNDLEELDLKDTDLDDEAMLHVAKLTNLKVLNLFQTKVTEVGFKILSRHLAVLEKFNMDTIEADDSCLRWTRSFRNLTHLDLFGAKITDHGCLDIVKADFPHLESLELCGGFVSDLGVAYLSTLKTKLKRLNLSQNSNITDNGVKRLATAFGMSLVSLSLSNTKITKKSVTLFYSFVFLEELVVRGCKLPNLSIISLKESLPNLWFVLV